MKSLKAKSFLLLFVLTLVSACRDEDPPPPHNEGELITTLMLTLTNSANPADVVNVVFSDPDGVGGNPPTRFDTIGLKAGTVYHCTLELLDESKEPPVDISHEIEHEATDHQFYYLVNGLDLTIAYDDADPQGRPLGLHSVWQAGAAGSGTVTVMLKHKPGIKGDNDPPTVGDTDVEVTFVTRLY